VQPTMLNTFALRPTPLIAMARWSASTALSKISLSDA
jgi:hypothetical protein